jgi:beta-lactamase regulating signal transducer with metallopeptidase domain
MLSGGPLTSVSAFLTCLIQIAIAYLAAFLICVLIRAPRIRLRVWSAVLVFAFARWVMVCTHTTTPAAPASVVARLPDNAALDWTWPVMGSWGPYIAMATKWSVRLYLAILALALVRLFWAWLRLQFLLRAGDNPSAEVQALFEDLCRETNIRHCSIRLVSDLSSPATAGWWHPRIVLPAEVVPRLNVDDLSHVLRHELTHVRHRDYLWDVLANIACRLLFFHPAVWLAYRKLRWERELSCDQAVVQDRQEVRLQYAECLAKLARSWYISEKRRPEGIGLSASASLLTTRVRALLCEPYHTSIYSKLSRVCLISAVALLCVAILPAAGLRLYWSTTLSSIAVLSGNTMHAKRVPKVRRLSQPRLRQSVSESVPEQAGIPGSEMVSSILRHSSTGPMPVLVEQRAGQSEAVSPTQSPTYTEAGQSGGVWREAPIPGASSPNWQRVATDAATAIMATAGKGGGGGETQDGQSGQQGNH